MNYTPRTVERLARNSKWLFALVLLLLPGCTTVVDTSHTFQTVVIDPGHGGKDSGTHSRIGGQEKNNALDVARRVNADLEHAGFRTVMTRDQDVFIPLNDRAAISNRQENAIFVSIHFNDSRNHSIRGAEAYYNSGAAAQLAGKIEGNLGQMCPVRFMKYANFRVLRLNQYPAVLVECGYLSNKSEARLCANAGYRIQIADRIAAGIIQQRYGEEAVRKVAETPVNRGAAALPIMPARSWSPEGFPN
jgi:N-acetylmuramoyl-L-alanine amidase